MSTSVGTISLDMVLNGTNFRKQLSNVQNQANAASQKMAASFKKIGAAVAAAFSTAMITKFAKSCIDLGSDLAEVQNVVDVTFTTMSDKVNEWAVNAQKAYGLSETMAKKYVGTFGSMAEAFGFTEQQSYDMATSLAGLTGDVASFYNLSQDLAYTKLKSVFSGETETLKDLGIVMTQSALDNYALANGYGKTVKEMTEAEKVTLRYNFVLGQLKNATGDFTRTQDSWANQTRILTLRFDSLKATIGQGLINALTPALKFLNSLMEKLNEVGEAFQKLTEKIFGNAGTADTSATPSTDGIESITENADEATSSLDNVAKSAEKAKGSLAGFDKLNVLPNTNSSSSDSSASGSSAISGIGQGASSSSTQNASKGLINSLENAFNKMYEKSGFKDFVEKVQKGINSVDWSAIGENCKKIFEKTVPIAQTYVQGVAKAGKSALGAVGSYVSGVVKVAGKSFQTLTGGISKWLEKDGNRINKFIENYYNSISKGFDNLSTFFDGWFDIIGKSVDRMRPTMETAISNLLSGFSDFGIGVGTVISEGFEIATESLVKWIDEDGAEIGLFFDNLQSQIADVMSTVGSIFSDVGTTISNWWNGDGAGIFQNVCDMFTNIGTTFMNVWNDWIKPAWDFIVGTVQSAWNNWLSPVFDSIVKFFGKWCDCIATVWNNFLSPLVNYIVDFWGPIITNIFNAIKGVFDTVFTTIGGFVSGLLEALGGLLDFVTGVFSGDWEKAWNGIKDFFTGIWEGIWSVLKGVINLIIDALNCIWTGVYNVVSGIINGIGGIAGALGDIFGQDWHFSMPAEPTLIPKFAKGAIVKAPTLAVVGDNAGANTGDPEVISPLSKLQSMIKTSSGEDVVILKQMLDYLKRIYEMFVIFRNNGGNHYEFVAKINGSEIFDEIVRQNELYKKRHNGKSAFA